MDSHSLSLHYLTELPREKTLLFGGMQGRVTCLQPDLTALSMPCIMDYRLGQDDSCLFLLDQGAHSRQKNILSNC